MSTTVNMTAEQTAAIRNARVRMMIKAGGELEQLLKMPRYKNLAQDDELLVFCRMAMDVAGDAAYFMNHFKKASYQLYLLQIEGKEIKPEPISKKVDIANSDMKEYNSIEEDIFGGIISDDDKVSETKTPSSPPQLEKKVSETKTPSSPQGEKKVKKKRVAAAKPAWKYFAADNKKRIKAEPENKDKKTKEMNTIYKTRYDTLSEEDKKPYQEKEAKDKIRWEADKKANPPTPKPKKAKKAKKPKKGWKGASSAFIFFSNDKRSEVRTNNPEMKMGDVGKELGKMWRGLTSEQKKPYADKAAADKIRAQKDKKAYEDKMAAEKKSLGYNIFREKEMNKLLQESSSLEEKDTLIQKKWNLMGEADREHYNKLA